MEFRKDDFMDLMQETVAMCGDGDWPLEPVLVSRQDNFFVMTSNGNGDTRQVIFLIDPETLSVVKKSIYVRAMPI